MKNKILGGGGALSLFHAWTGNQYRLCFEISFQNHHSSKMNPENLLNKRVDLEYVKGV